MKVSPVKNPIVRKAMKRAQQIIKKTPSKQKGGYVSLDNGKSIFIAGGKRVDAKVRKVNEKLLGIGGNCSYISSHKTNELFFNVRSKNVGGYMPIENGKSIFIAGGPEIDKKVAEANRKLDEILIK